MLTTNLISSKVTIKFTNNNDSSNTFTETPITSTEIDYSILNDNDKETALKNFTDGFIGLVWDNDSEWHVENRGTGDCRISSDYYFDPNEN